MTKRSDEELLLAAGRGDHHAFGRLVERHHRCVVHFIYRLLGCLDRDQAEDLAQDVFLRAWKGSRRFRPRAKCATWLLQIARNVSLNHLRAYRLRKTRPLDECAGVQAVPDRALADALDTNERVRYTRAAISGLPEKQRAAIILRHFHEFSYSDIAAVLGLSNAAVETLLFRARRMLRTILAHQGGDSQDSPESRVQSSDVARDM